MEQKTESIRFDIYPDEYTIAATSEMFGAAKLGNELHWMKVKHNSTFTYNLLSKPIEARDGAFGLFDYIVRCRDEQFMECLAKKVIEYVIAHGKAKEVI